MSWLIALAIGFAAGLGMMGIGSFLLRDAARDASDLVSKLPTRLINEDTSQMREANRRRELRELVLLLTVRALPGVAVVFCGVGLAVWICCKVLDKLGK